MKKKLQFVEGDIVRCGQWVGTITEISDVYGTVNCKVISLDRKTTRDFKPEEIQRVNFNIENDSEGYMGYVFESLHGIVSQWETSEKDNSKVMKNMSVDDLLDTYNSNKKLYELTGEEDFKAAMDEVMSRLKEVGNKK